MATREVLDKQTLNRRLLVLFALGTNMGIRQMAATGDHGQFALSSPATISATSTCAGRSTAACRSWRTGTAPTTRSSTGAKAC
ncbi:hypothetical protein ACFY19_04435 [Streptosporangium saharense]|uniref:hypothetical protein n=1 Tax=Streptosporangium saharense TaxID=1706840 RepID=UPI0036BC1AD9